LRSRRVFYLYSAVESLLSKGGGQIKSHYEQSE